MSEYEFVERDVLPLLKRFNDLGVRDRYICDLAHISAASLSRARSGADLLQAQAFLDLKNLLVDCEVLAERNILPPDWSDLRSVRVQLEALHRERANPPQPLSQSEADLLHKFATGDDIDSLAIEVRMSRGELLDKISELVSRSGRLASAAK